MNVKIASFVKVEEGVWAIETRNLHIIAKSDKLINNGGW